MTQPDLSSYLVNIIQKQFDGNEAISSAFEESALLMAISGKQNKGDGLDNLKVKRLAGPDFDFPVRKLSDVVTSAFIPGGTTDTTTYTELETTQMAKAYFGYMQSPLRLNKILMMEAADRGSAVDYVEDNVSALLNDSKSKIALDIFQGNGNGVRSTLSGVSGSAAQNLYGQIYQLRDFSGTFGTNTSNQSTNTHFNLYRHLTPEFVSNVASAASVDDGAGASWVTDASVTLTNGSTEISNLASADYSAYRHWRVFYKLTTEAASAYRPITSPIIGAPRGYVVADATSGAATTLQMSQVWRGTTGTYSIQLRPWFRSDTQGAASVPSLQKLKLMQSVCNSANSKIDLMLAGAATYNAFTDLLVTNERYIAGAGNPYTTDKRLDAWGYDNVKIGSGALVIDNYVPEGRVMGYDSKLLRPRLHKRFDKFKLTDKDFMPLTDGERVMSEGAVMVVALQIVAADLSRTFVIEDINV